MEKYDDCPYQLKAELKRFDSLQCQIRACGGIIDNQPKFNEICLPCENYIVNAQKRDYERSGG
ncbi:MAG: hypothetical protein PHH54_05275 [Candidatus Nanoarchaeia archaeon]|nr:hypothetical protein [Candidatus Nanoarchaeia archaeon]MDD5741369.1 hypothetical protein [Candidatus Nanoarchaeia archaeon]